MSKLRTDIGALAQGVLFIYLELFGLFASYQLDRFWLGLIIPPVAWFDSLYYWVAPAQYERHWDRNVEVLGKVIISTEEELQKAGKGGLEVQELLRTWVESVPPALRLELAGDYGVLYDAFFEFLIAAVQHHATTGGALDAPTIPTQLTGKKGMERLWTYSLDQLKTIQDTMLSVQNGNNAELKKELGKTIESNKDTIGVVATMMKSHCRRRIDQWLK